MTTRVVENENVKTSVAKKKREEKQRTNVMQALMSSKGGGFETVKPIAERKGQGEVHHVATIPGRDLLVTAGEMLEVCQIHRKRRNPITSCFKSRTQDDEEKLEIIQLKTLNGHKKRVTDIRVSHDERTETLFSASADNQCLLWNTYTWKKKHALGTDKQGIHRFGVHSIAPLIDTEEHLATCGGDHLIKLWDIEENKAIVEIREASEALKIVSGRNGIVFSGNKEGLVKIWDMRLGKEVGTLGGKAHSSQISDMKYLPDDDVLYTSSFDCLVKKWDDPCSGTSGPLVFRGHKGIVKGLEVSSRYLYTCSINCTIRIWDITSAQIVNTLLLPGWPNCLQLVSDDKMSLACQDRVVSLWKVNPTMSPRNHQTHLFVTDPNTLKVTHVDTKTFVLVKGIIDGRNITLRKKAMELDLPSITSTILSSLRDEEEQTAYAGSLKKTTNRSLTSTATVTFEIPEEADDQLSPGSRVNAWKVRWEAEHAKLIRTQDALKEARLAKHQLQLQLEELACEEDVNDIDTLSPAVLTQPYGDGEMDLGGSLSLRSGSQRQPAME